MSTRVADYFFVAGLHDSHIIPTFDSAKKNQRIADNDVSYYQQQEAAVAGQFKQIESQPQPQPPTVIDPSRRRGQSLSVIPTEPSLRSTFPEVTTSASLLGVLDHVQSVIDNFDKERDTARDNVIAVHEPTSRRHTEKYNGTETLPNNRTSSYSTDTTRRLSVREVSARKWRSPSDPKICNDFT